MTSSLFTLFGTLLLFPAILLYGLAQVHTTENNPMTSLSFLSFSFDISIRTLLETDRGLSSVDDFNDWTTAPRILHVAGVLTLEHNTVAARSRV